MFDFKFIEDADPEIADTITKEMNRQEDNIELIASENFVSEAVMATMGSPLTNKYAEGYPGRRYYGGCEFVDIAEDLARDRVCEIFNADHANVQPHSGANANIAVFFSVLDPGDKVMGMNLNHGGHLTHGSPVNMSGKHYNIIPYGVDKDTGTIDYDEMEKIAREEKPKLIIAGGSAYAREIDFKRFADVAKEIGAYFMVDMAHFAGLVAAGLHPNPCEYADFVTSTTHKTLRGPRGGLILCKEEHAKKIDSAIFPGIQGGPLMHIIAAKAVAFKEAQKPEFKTYQEQVLKNAHQLSESLIEHGFDIVSGGTDTHLVLVDLRKKNVTGKDAEAMLDEVAITVNKNTIPFDPESPFVTSGIRLGTPAMTTRGFVEDDMKEIAELIALTIDDFDANKEDVKKRAIALTGKYPLFK